MIFTDQLLTSTTHRKAARLRTLENKKQIAFGPKIHENIGDLCLLVWALK